MTERVRQQPLCGYLNIEETEMSGHFCRRYFILDRANKKLAYYMNCPESLPESWKNPVGEIYLQYINSVSDARKMRLKVPLCFAVSVAGRQYFLQADDLPSMRLWMEGITSASKITVPSSECPTRANEWHAGDLSRAGYITEIAGGVVCKIPMQSADDLDSESEDSESLSSSSGKVSPGSSISFQLNSVSGEQGALDVEKMPALARFQPVKAGYAVKQGGVRKNWKRRFFLLHTQGLSYFKSEQEREPLRTVPISEVLDVRQAGVNLSRDNLFEIHTNKRVFYIQCDSAAEMFSWVHEIRSVVFQGKDALHKSAQQPGDCGSEKVNQGYSVWV